MLQDFIRCHKICYIALLLTHSFKHTLSSVFSTSVVFDEVTGDIFLSDILISFTHCWYWEGRGNVLSWVIFERIYYCIPGFNNSRIKLTSTKSTLHGSWPCCLSVITWTGQHVFRHLGTWCVEKQRDLSEVRNFCVLEIPWKQSKQLCF